MAVATNLLLLGAEAALYFAVMAALFRFRHRFGIGTFFCALGSIHFLETYLASILYVSLPFGMVISPGSAVLFSGKLVMLLLVYIREDASTVRQPIYGLLIGNFLMVGLVLLMRHHVLVPAVPEQFPDFRFMNEMAGLMIWGTLLLFIDSILIILVYEQSSEWLGERQALRIVLSAALVLSFDQLGFFAALRIIAGVPIEVLYSGWVAKVVASIAFGLMTAAYLRWLEPPALGQGGQAKLSDGFDALTYRERYEALLQQSGRDSLTGLLNRGSFDAEVGQAIAEATKAGRPISCLVIDIDHFKRINDQHGHAVGDETLRQIGTGIVGVTRSSDRIYRYGGEEFVVLSEGLAYSSALVAAERLRRTIANCAVPGIETRVTASIGVATAPADGTDLLTLFGAADARFYKAKATGRDRTVGRAAEKPTAGRSAWDERRPA